MNAERQQFAFPEPLLCIRSCRGHSWWPVQDLCSAMKGCRALLGADRDAIVPASFQTPDPNPSKYAVHSGLCTEPGRSKNLISLNEVDRRKERDAKEARRLSRDSQGDIARVARPSAAGKGDVFRDDGLQVNERNLTKELAAEKEQKEAKDVFLIEAAHILADEVDVLKAGAIESKLQSIVRRVVSR